jgi:hypothetical protein
VKRLVEAGDLPQTRTALAERLDQLDLAWQMIRCIRRCAMQFVEHVRRDWLRLGVRHPMDDTVSEERAAWPPERQLAAGHGTRSGRT